MSHRNRPSAFVIVGGGVASGAAAVALREAGHRGRIVLVSEERALPYRRGPLAGAYLRGEIDRDALAVRPASWYRDYGVDLLLGATATRIDATARLVEVQGHGPLAYDRLLLAAGTRDRFPPIPGANRIRSIADADALRRRARTGRSAVVLGAGRWSRDIGLALASMGLRVRRLAQRPGDILEADIIVDAREWAPRTELAQAAGLRVDDDGVEVDALGLTTDGRIGAAGSMVHRVDPLTGSVPRALDDRHAADLGAAAARALVRLPSPFASEAAIHNS